MRTMRIAIKIGRISPDELRRLIEGLNEIIES
jgi:hypothetical protein